MTIDFDAELFGPVHEVLGTSATITPEGTAGAVSLVLIDESAGIVLPGRNGVEISTVRPAAVVRAVALAEAGLDRADLRNAALLMNGTTYRIKSSEPKPTANGEADGEIVLWLVEG
jgi:hypothetical protein